MERQNFFLFRRETKIANKYEYIQLLTSPSFSGGLSYTSYPEFAWRGKTTLDILKIKYLISISKFYKISDWTLVRYNMDCETPSWAIRPKQIDYESLDFDEDLFLTPNSKESIELEEWKISAYKRYADK